MVTSLPRDVVLEIMLWLTKPSWPHRLHNLSREHRCLACLTCFQLRGHMNVTLFCYTCLRPVKGLACGGHRHIAGPACAVYTLATGEEYSYNSETDRVHCEDCLWRSTLPDDDEDDDDDDDPWFFSD